jgi:hypothetical protein
MPSNKENVGTFLLSGETMIILEEFGVRNVSVKLVSGMVTVKGTQKLGARDCDAIVVTAENPINISFDFPIDGYTIDASGGSAQLVTGR